MKITLNYAGKVGRTFTYQLTRFDDARKFSVRYHGVALGDVAELAMQPGEWFATYDHGDADSLRWFGGFTSRREASMFLLAAKIQRDMPAHTNRPTRTAAIGDTGAVTTR